MAIVIGLENDRQLPGRLQQLSVTRRGNGFGGFLEKRMWVA
jgi:hypothetical protein